MSLMKREQVIRKLAVASDREQKVFETEMTSWMKSRKSMKMSELKAQAKYLLLQHSGNLGSYEADAILATTGIDTEFGIVFRGSYVQDRLDGDMDDAINGVISSESMRQAGNGARAVLARRVSGTLSTLLTQMVNNTVDRTSSYYLKGGEREFYIEGEKVVKTLNVKSSSKWKRVVNPGACEWCADQSRNAFERHNGCKCGRVKVSV